MPEFRTFAVAALAAGLLVAGAVEAQGGPSKAEQTLKYRKSLYQVLGYNFGPMGAMTKGTMPYDQAEFARRAERVAMIAPLLSEGFSADTKGLPHSDLKAEMWENRADFDAKMKDLVDRSAALAVVAKSGDAAKTKAAFMETAKTCGACHDKYRND